MLKDALINQGLSNRETDVAVLVSKGWRNKEVASTLFVTEKTVKFHLTNIFKKMKVKSRTQLVLWCMPHMTIEDHQQRQVIEATGDWAEPKVEPLPPEMILPKSAI